MLSSYGSSSWDLFYSIETKDTVTYNPDTRTTKYILVKNTSNNGYSNNEISIDNIPITNYETKEYHEKKLYFSGIL